MKKLPSNTLSESLPGLFPADLQAELYKLAQHIVRCTDTSCQGEAPLAVVRLIPEITMDDWKKLASTGSVDGWFALDLQAYPSLQQVRHALVTLSQSQSDHVLSGRDASTGAMTREVFLQRFNEEAGRARREQGHLCLTIFELTHWERWNKAKGWEAGDKLLQDIVARIWASISPQDVLGRLSGKQFGLVLPGASRYHALASAEDVLCQTHSLVGSEGLEECGLQAVVLECRGKFGQEDSVVHWLQEACSFLESAGQSSRATPRERVCLCHSQACEEERKTLVQASEKHFLFFGQ